MTITPDTKNWTWVLDRPCPECGFEAASIDRTAIGALLRANAQSWVAVLAAEDVATRPAPGKWSPLEYACHVRDCNKVYDHRLRLMLTEEDPAYPNWDQDESAVTGKYDEQDPARVAEAIVATAATLADRFDAVADDEWERTGRRSDGSSFTVESIGRYFIHDPLHHLWDVTGKAQG